MRTYVITGYTVHVVKANDKTVTIDALSLYELSLYAHSTVRYIELTESNFEATLALVP